MLRRKQSDGTTVLEGGALTLAAAINIFHPVNSIIMTTDNVNPGTRFPGTTWTAWGAGRAVVGVGSNGVNSYTSEQTFGADSVTLTAAQSGVNAHTHVHTLAAPAHTHSTPNHTHDFNAEYSTNTTMTGSGVRITDIMNSGSGGTGTQVTPTTLSGGGGTSGGASATALTGAMGAVSGASSATAHENRPSSIATYLWKRTA